MANFRTKARAIDLLGRNQIADLPTAITELWKNGYDAYGDYLDAGLYRSGYKDVKHDIFTLSDDGFGMNQDDILNKWIVIGTDNKKREDNVVPEKDRFGKKIRVPLGEKGIGRLSVTYLGNHMLMITKKENEPYQLLFMNWKAFENFDLYLDEVEIPTVGFVDIDNINREYRYLQEIYLNNFKSESWDNFVELKADILGDLARYADIPIAVIGKIKEHYAERKHGTYFVIFDPIKEILELETEQDDNLKEAQEEIAEQTKYVRSALSGLFNPFDEELTLVRKGVLETDFSKTPSVQIYSANNTEHDFLQMKEFFTPDEFENCEHWIDGYFDATGVFEGEIKVFGKIEKYKYIPRTQPRANIGKFRLKLAFWEGSSVNSSMSQEVYSKYEEKGENFSGLYVYRDGFRVLPYGRTDFDFLEFEKRRSNNAGRYYFSHRKMIGFIGITKKGNKNLIDKSGREGFVSNDAYRSMKTLLINFFKEIAKEKYGTHSEARTEFLEKKRRENEREKIIAEEKKKNSKAIVLISKKVNENKDKLKNKKAEVEKLKRKIEAHMQKRKFLDTEAKEVLAEANQLRKDITELEIIIPRDVTLTGYDSLLDNLYLYEEERKRIEKIILDCSKLAKENIYVNVLKDDYTEKFQRLQKEVNEMLITFDLNVSNTIAELRNQINQEVSSIKEDMCKFSPESIEINNLSEIQTIQKMEEFEKYVYESIKAEETKFESFLQRLQEMSFEKDWGKTLEAYKSKEIELTKQVDTFYELAQVGMSIEVIDHQFNVLYAQMTNSLNKLRDVSARDKEVAEIYDPLKMAFQHLEANHKMLMPMYRTTRRSKTLITGKSIQDIMYKFYGEIMKKEKVELVCTDVFLDYSISSFESIVVPVFLNIVNNAIYWLGYSDGKRVIKMDIKNDEILIMNSGPQMSHTELTRCFEIFYTKKASGRGIGLYLAKKCLNSIDKDIYATNDETYNLLNGACFVICNHEGE
ncbi:MAG: ATP-binding protein [Tyzzerella sp.]|nr:ATP-binding protein [Tyzzerella sp.]